MSYNDKKSGFTLPTRTGTATGGANERQMLDITGGPAGYRKQFRLNPDGSTTMMTTKNGMPQFSTGPGLKKPLPDEGDGTMFWPYMETGQLEWTFPGEGNPTKYQPATWHFLGVGEGARYLGYIEVDGKQHNLVALHDGQESQAIGTPKPVQDPNNTTATKLLDAKAAAANGGFDTYTVSKKLVAGIFPPSLFSGKMRLFIQALYGAKEAADFPLEIDTSIGTTLRYSAGGASIQFGLWAHHSPGVVGSNGVYWLVTLTTPNPAKLRVTAYKMRPKVGFDGFFTAKGADPIKAEAYALSTCVIDTAHPMIVGEYGWSGGDALAYGWKWNKNGTIAKVVTHTVENSAGGGGKVWVSRTSTVTIGASATTVSASMSTVVNGEWTDGWGSFNLFAPSDETGLELRCQSIAMDRVNVKPQFNFSGIDVYGYFVDDEWVPVQMSRELPTDMKRTVVVKNMFFGNPTQGPEAVWGNDQATWPAWLQQYCYHQAGTACDMEDITPTAELKMNVSVGGATTEGRVKTGSHSRFIKYIGEGLLGGAQQQSMTNGVDFIGAFTTPFMGGAPQPAGYPAWWMPDYYHYLCEMVYDYVEIHKWSYIGTSSDYWALVIPAGDCSAVLVATKSTRTSDGSVTHNISVGRGITKFRGTVPSFTLNNTEYPPLPFEFSPWTMGGDFGDWYGFDTSIVHSVDYIPPPPPETSVYAYNTAVSGRPGTPSGSYYTLFNVSLDYPVYNGTMYSYTSHGKQYVISEGLRSSALINYQHRFVGWA